MPAKPRVRPIIQCHGFIPPNTGFSIYVAGVRRPTKINLDSTVRTMQDFLDTRSFTSIDEGFEALANQYGFMEVNFREPEHHLPASIAQLYLSATDKTEFLSGHVPILKSWLGPAAPVILSQNPTSWKQVFEILERSRGQIATAHGFSCNYLDWCEAKISKVPEATISGSKPTELPGVSGNYIRLEPFTFNDEEENTIYDERNP